MEKVAKKNDYTAVDEIMTLNLKQCAPYSMRNLYSFFSPFAAAF